MVSFPVKVAPLFANSTPAAPKPAAGPRVLFGESKLRKRIDVELADLKYPNAPIEALREAHQQIITLNVDEVNVEYVLNWGAGPQSEHEALLSILLNSAIERESGNAKNLILEIIQLIEAVDFDSLNKTGLFTGSRESKLTKIKTALDNVRAASDSLLTQLPSLKAAWKDLDGMEAKLAAIGKRLEPWIISCDFFANYVKPNFPSELFVSRLISLTSTKLTIVQNQQQRELLEQSALNLVATIQGTIRGEIPAWHNAYLNVLTSGVNPANLSSNKQSILTKLKSVA